MRNKMAIKPPNWCRHAVPTTRGWVDPRTKELLQATTINQIQIDEWNGVTPKTVESAPTVLREAPMNNSSLEEMTKFELESLGRQHGIELDRRKRKDDLIEEISEHLE